MILQNENFVSNLLSSAIHHRAIYFNAGEYIALPIQGVQIHVIRYHSCVGLEGGDFRPIKCNNGTVMVERVDTLRRELSRERDALYTAIDYK